MLGLIRQFPAKPDAADFGRLAVGVIVFLLLLIYPPPPLLNSIVIDRRNWIALLVLLAFFIFLLNRNENGWETVQIAFIFALFAIPLVYKWQSAHYDGYIIGGLLPWSDASAYSWEAHRLANGALLTAWGARRPLFSGFLAVLLRTTGGDFMAALIILTLSNILAVFFVVRIVKRLYGSTAAGFFLIISFEFYTRFSGVTTSEQLGFAAGNLALYFLLIGAHTRDMRKALFGLGLLTLALNARAGAFFILPALILWLALSFRQRTTFWRAGGMAIVVVIAVFLLNLILVRAIAEPQSAPFSNYSYTLYGLASGNKGWDQVIIDHPNVSEQEVMPLAIQKIRSEPTLLLQGMLGSFADYFGPNYYGAFNFMYRGSIRQQINLMFWTLVASGLAYSILKWREGLHGLVLASFLGVITSLPLLPPIDADAMRVFAATIPFSALWVVTGVSALFTWGRKLIIQKEANDAGKATGSNFQKPALFFSALLVFLAAPAPLFLRAFAHAPSSSDSLLQPTCAPAEELLNGIKFKSISILIVQDDAADESYMPFIRISDFQKAITTTSSLYPFLDEELLNLKAGDQVSFGLNLVNGIPDGSLWMISKFPVMEGEFNVCGRITDNKELHPYSFYYLEGASVPASSLTVSQENPIITRLIRLLYGVTIGIVLFLLVMGLIGFTNLSLVGFLYTAGIVILILPGVFVSLYVNGKLLSVPILVEQRITLQMRRAVPQEGNMYILPLGIDWMSQADLGRSPAVVYENDIPLKRPNSLRKAIREKGNGRYSVWEGDLYFSSSDNTDPRVNGRKYEIEWPYPIPPALQWLSYLISIAGIALIFLGKYIMPKNLWTGKPETSLEANSADQQQ